MQSECTLNEIRFGVNGYDIISGFLIMNLCVGAEIAAGSHQTIDKKLELLIRSVKSEKFLSSLAAKTFHEFAIYLLICELKRFSGKVS